MKRTTPIIFLIILLASAFGINVHAQEFVPEGYVQVDSVVYRPVATVDTTLAGKDIFLLMPTKEAGASAEVKINQTYLFMVDHFKWKNSLIVMLNVFLFLVFVQQTRK